MIAGAMALFPADAGAANYAQFALLPGTAAIVWSRRGTLLTAVAAGVGDRRRDAQQAELAARRRAHVPQRWPATAGGATWCSVSPDRPRPSPRPASTPRSAGSGSGTSPTVPGFVFAGSGSGRRIGEGPRGLAGFAMFHPVPIVALVGERSSARRRRDPTSSLAGRSRPVDLDARPGMARMGSGTAVLRPLLVAGGSTARRCWPCPSSRVWTGRARLRRSPASPSPRRSAWVLLFVPGSFHRATRSDGFAGCASTPHPTTGDRVFVWGSYPEVLVAAERLPAGDWCTPTSSSAAPAAATTRQRHSASAIPGAAGHHAGSLAAHPPVLILDTSTVASNSATAATRSRWFRRSIDSSATDTTGHQRRRGRSASPLIVK